MRYVYRYDPRMDLHHVFNTSSVDDSWDTYVEIRTWCITTFGAPGVYAPESRWCASKKAQENTGTMAILFRDETDALHFRMRWC